MIPEVRRDSPLSVVQDAGATDVDLVAVPRGSGSLLGNGRGGLVGHDTRVSPAKEEGL